MSDSSPGVLVTIAAFLLVIGPLIFVHELGHYFMGRLFGVKADVFSIGFGRELLGWTDRRGTRWKVAALPLGGYVKFAGDMNPASTPSADWLALPPHERARTFQGKKVWQRFLIVAAGPITNFLFAIVVFAAVFGFVGQPRTPAVVGQVAAGSAAAGAGLKAGDSVLSVEGRAMDSFEDLVSIVAIHPGDTLDFVIRRGSVTRALRITLGAHEISDQLGGKARVGVLGVASGPTVVEKRRLIELPGAAIGYTWEKTRLIVDTTLQLITGARPASELSGPVGMARISGRVVMAGPESMALFMAFISINLGFINLLPVPLLDGGHLMFYVIEGIRRRPMDERVQEWAFRSGLALLLTLMAFVTLNDLLSVGVWDRLARLIG